MGDEMLTVKALQRELNIAQSLAYDLVQSGKLPAIKVGATWRVSRRSLLQWIKAQEQAARRGSEPAASGAES